MKRTIMVILVIALAFCLTACGCKHEWREATCLEPKTCKNCGATEGDVADHAWEEATATTPKTCKVCKATEGEALGYTSGVSINAMETAVRNAAENKSLSFDVSNAEDGKVFELAFATGMFGTDKEIKGAADKNSNITWIEYSIPKFDETLYDELTMEKLLADNKNFKDIPMGILTDELDLLAYSYIMSCITGDSYSDYYGFDTLMGAKDSSLKKDEWVYSMSMDGSTLVIRAEYQPE